MNILLVGENASFLRILSLELYFQGFSSRMVGDVRELVDALQEEMPDVIVFDHVEPLDLLSLNPRDLGYEGPLFLLSDAHPPEQLLERLPNTGVLIKPFLLERLSAEIRLVVQG